MEIATFTALAATSTLVCRTRRAARHGGGPSTTDTADGASGADSVHTPTPRERVTAGPYTASQSILILGDGDFTFSAALVGAFIDQGCPDACERIIATSYDTLADLHARYPRVVPETLAVLKAHNVRTLHGVDATNLHATLPHDLDGVRFDRVVFNFPHHSGKGLIQVNRALLSGTLVSCQDILKPAAEGGELHIPLAPGQGGTPIDEPRKFGNHWHVVQAAGNAGLDLVAVTPYDFTPFKGYSVTGRRGAQMTFRSHGSLLHVFRLPAVPSPLPARLARLRALQEAGVWRTPTFRRALTHATPAFVQQRLSNDSRRILRSRSHPTSRCMAVLERSARGVLPDARCFVSRDRATVVQAASLPRTFGTQHRFHSCLFHTDAPGAPGASGAPSTQVLRPWLSEQLRQVWNRRHTPSSSTVAMVSGAVSRREAWIDRFSSPVQHECEMLVSADHMTAWSAQERLEAAQAWALEVVASLCDPSSLHVWFGPPQPPSQPHPLDATHDAVAGAGWLEAQGQCPISLSAKLAEDRRDDEAGVAVDGTAPAAYPQGFHDLGHAAHTGHPPSHCLTCDGAVVFPTWATSSPAIIADSQDMGVAVTGNATTLWCRRVGVATRPTRLMSLAPVHTNHTGGSGTGDDSTGLRQARGWWARVHVDALAACTHPSLDGVAPLWSRHPSFVQQFARDTMLVGGVVAPAAVAAGGAAISGAAAGAAPDAAAVAADVAGGDCAVRVFPPLRWPTMWPHRWEFQLALSVPLDAVWDQSVLMAVVREILGNMVDEVMPVRARSFADPTDGCLTLAYSVVARCCDHALSRQQVHELLKLMRLCLGACVHHVTVVGT